MNKLSLGLDSPWIQLLQSRRIKRLPLWILAAVSDREKRDFALTAGSSFGLIYNMNNERSIFVKKLEDRKLNRRNTVLVRAPDGHFGQLGGFGGVSCRASSTLNRFTHGRGSQGRTRKLGSLSVVPPLRSLFGCRR